MSEPGKASVTVNRRVYRQMSAGDAVGWALLPALFLALMLNGLARGANALFIVPVVGIIVAFMLLMIIVSLNSVTVVSAAGVRPGRLNARVIPWEEIDSFAAIETEPYGGRDGRGNNSWRVLLIPVENRRPITLSGCGGKGGQARHNVDELNNILAAIRARRTDGPAQS